MFTNDKSLRVFFCELSQDKIDLTLPVDIKYYYFVTIFEDSTFMISSVSMYFFTCVVKIQQYRLLKEFQNTVSV